VHYTDLRDFTAQLERLGELKRVATEVSPRLEMTEICDRVLRQGGPALLFERPAGHTMPVLDNLFGTVRRVCLAMGVEDSAALRELGKLLDGLVYVNGQWRIFPKAWRAKEEQK